MTDKAMCTMAEPDNTATEAREVVAMDASAIRDAPEVGEVVYVEMPEWGDGVVVGVRSLSGYDRDKFEADVNRRGNMKLDNFRARFAALVLADDDGKPLFNWRNGEDVEALGRKSACALDRVMTVGMKLNGFSAEDIDDMEKNSGTAQSGDSGSA